MGKFKYDETIGLYKIKILKEDGTLKDSMYLNDLTALVKSEKRSRFYRRKSWRKFREMVMKFYDFKCQAPGCKKRANVVHHIKILRENPELAFAFYYQDDRQLVPLCETCHSKVHLGNTKGEYLNEELNEELKKA